MAKSLYICYFGVHEPLVQTQVIPYLRELVKGGHEMSLLTFEPSGGKNADKAEGDRTRAELKEQGIEWHSLVYHKRFSVLATAYDVFCGTLFVRKMIRQKQLDILHGRVHVPTLMGAMARKFSSRKPKLLFDIRGFFPEEYTDAGVWPEGGLLYKTAKRVEKWLLKEADGFVVLTVKARDILFPEISENLKQLRGSELGGSDKTGRPVDVIPCCVDFSRYENCNDELRTEMREKLGVDGRFVVVYVGSFGGWYLTDEMVELFAVSRKFRSDAFAMILTQRDKEKIAKILIERGFTTSDFLVTSVRPDEIASYLSAADAAVSFIKACYSKQSSSPTKIAEYLASGLPIIANKGVGDVDALIEGNEIGVIIDEFSHDAYFSAFRKIESLEDVRSRSRQLSVSEFDLGKVGGERYRSLYSRLLSSTHEENGKVPKGS